MTDDASAVDKHQHLNPAAVQDAARPHCELLLVADRFVLARREQHTHLQMFQLFDLVPNLHITKHLATEP
jgi:hypothetical protein